MKRDCDKEIYELYDNYIDKLFINKKSFLENNEAIIFKEENINECIEYFIDKPVDSKKTFNEKLKDQFEEVSEEAKKLFAHAIWLWGFSVNGSRNCDLVFIEGEKTVRPEHGFGNCGQYHLSDKYNEICFVIRLFKAVFAKCKGKSKEEIKDFIEGVCLSYKYGKTYENYKNYEDLDVVKKQNGKRPMTDILLYLSKPENYEPIVSTTHKNAIVNCFYDLIKDDKPVPDMVDEQIGKIREKIGEIKRKENFSFYDFDLRRLWDAGYSEDDEDRLGALSFKKNIVLYGPPGTSKTHSAKQLARTLIAKKLIATSDMKIKDMIDSSNREADEYIRILQLHTNYTYDSFIIGQTIKNNEIVPVEGYFLSLCKEASEDKDNIYVLILDEINRVDLARLFGEAFSAIENRNEAIDLPFKDKDGNQYTLTVPDNIFIIGTMNEIDFSLERIDFALRRRFLWFEHSYSSETLNDMLEGKLDEYFNDEEIQKFIENSNNVNDIISETPELGSKYKIGHVFFAEIVKFFDQINNNPANKGKQKKTKKEEAKKALWKYSIMPMIDSYLDNISVERHKEIIDKIHGAYNG